MLELDRLERAVEIVRRDLLDARNKLGHWEGELSSSALSTATAVSALALDREAEEKRSREFEWEAEAKPFQHEKLIERGLAWLVLQQNEDGGWGDTDKSFSNIATTFLVKAAFHMAGQALAHQGMLIKADRYLESQGGVAGLRKRYGKDKTFAVPILTNCALAGLVPWSEVSALPFELACLPQRWFKHLQLPVVSYALPALIAIGVVRFHHRPPWFLLLRFARSAAVEPALRVLQNIQPASGGFLEATPLTSFVTMSLIACGRHDLPVTRSGVKFLVQSVREDGSWPIDTNLATWNTTLSINALAESGYEVGELGKDCFDWVLSCQHREVHPYTGADPGGWAWTDLSGGVPDADDTPGALLALSQWLNSKSSGLDEEQADALRDAAGHGAAWLLDLQNDDGGWPTFCRGWGALPFDRSGTDLTAHALRALTVWAGRFAGSRPLSPRLEDRYRRFDARIGRAVESGFKYLAKNQRADGSWLPLWFGNQFDAEEENPIYGTAKVLLAYRDLRRMHTAEAQRGLAWLAQAQNADGGWGRAAPEPRPGVRPDGKNGPAWGATVTAASSVEETALAVEALLSGGADGEHRTAWERGIGWLMQAVEQNCHTKCSPLGFYFAKLWYYESMYPLIFTLSALGRAQAVGRKQDQQAALETTASNH